MRLTPEQVAEEKKYLREFLEMLWFGEHVLTSAERDLFDTIEALQAENEQLRAQVVRMRNVIKEIKDNLHVILCTREMPDKVEMYANEAISIIDEIGGR